MKLKPLKTISWVFIVLVTTASLCPTLLFVRAEDDSQTLCSSSEQNSCQDVATFCLNDLQDFKANNIPQGTQHIKFQQEVQCDASIKYVLDWARRHGVTIGGTCAPSGCHAGQRICDLTDNLNCGHIRRRRSAVVDKESNKTNTTPYGPGGIPVLPCDFESGFCQWYQLSDSDFQWTRNKGTTPSHGTGPSGDHTTGNGYYVYIETSIPRKTNDKARLVSPTLRPVGKNQTCNITFFLHMHGSHIGKLNIYQAPVVGHDVIKKALTTSQADSWIREYVTFDSEREFQIIIEGVRGVSYKGDIALDDISLSPGCQRLEPAYVRLRSQNVEVYQNGTWGSVCNSGWTGDDSNVTCKELGYKSANHSFGSPMDSHVMSGFQSVSCSGVEKSIDKCPKTEWSNSITCTNNQTASLQCSGIVPVCPMKTHFYCAKKLNDTAAKCISVAQRCDFVNDCWDGSDETNCDNYTRCTFEDPNLCGWLQALNDHLNWTRHKGGTPSWGTGPSKDHNGDTTKYYIYANVRGRSQSDKGRIAATPRFQGDHEGLCKVRFFYHMYGWATGKLRVLISDIYTTRTVWEKTRSHGNQWVRAEVTLLNTTRSFQVMFEAEHSGYFLTGDIAIDDVSFTPECRPAKHDNVTCKEGTFKCRSGECIPLEDRCDFKMDCFDGFDELSCGFEQPGRCNFEQGFCDWRNETDDRFDFERNSRNTLSYGTGPSYDHTFGNGKNGYYVYIEASSPRRRGDNARLAGPQFMWRGIKGCRMRFFYHMFASQNYYFVGTLKALLRNVITKETITLWQRTGNQGNRWVLADVPIATNWSVAQIVIEASVGLGYQSDIAVDDISFSPQCYPDIPAHVDKNYDVRLVGKKSSYQGRVEVYRVGYWGTVCNDGWDGNDMKVVCKQLGYAGAVTSLNTIPGKGQIWLDNLKCFGNESNLNMCGHNGWSVHNCDHDKDATVVCAVDGDNTVPLRLSGYNNDSRRGVVEVYRQGIWGSVCFDDWDLHDAHVACRQAGFLGIERVTKETTHSTNKIWLSKVSCQGNEDSLGKCSHSVWGVVNKCDNGYAGVVCKQQSASEGDVRLVGGRSAKEGRVEIFHRGEWGTVCEEKWGLKDAQVVCFELGFTGVVSYYQSFGPGTGRVWLNNVECTGTESSLTSCARSSWGNNPCNHNEDIGVICGDDAYVGCYKDNSPRVMPHKMSMKDLTPPKCLRYCRSKGYSYAGLEWGSDCYCGDHYNKYGNASSGDCSTPCSGDYSKICGGPYRLSVYATNPAILPSAAPGWLPVRQSCSSVTYFGNYAILNPISSPNYFSGDHKSGYIWSPKYPANYPNKIHCVWVLNLLPGSKAKISFLRFNLEDTYDIFEARDGKRQYSTRLTPYFGFTGNKSSTLTASSNIMWLKFYADESVSMPGFKLQYIASGLEPSTTPGPTTLPALTTINPSSLPDIQKVVGGCNGKLHTVNVTFGYNDKYHSTGYIQSPGYPAFYGSNQKCNWTIVVQTAFKIKVNIKLYLESSNDWFAVGDGQTMQSSRDHSSPWNFVSRDRMIRVALMSRSTSRRKRAIAPQGFYMTYKREPKDSNGSFNKHKRSGSSLSGGSIAGIVVAFIVLSLVILVLVFLLIKKKKKRDNPSSRHCFVNQAYDNTDGMVMTNPASGPTPPSGQQDASIFYANVAVAPPPYTPQADTTDPVPGYTAPTAPDSHHYAGLYAQPPPYQTSRDRNTTTTGIGSVTSLRDAASADSALPGAGAPVLPRQVNVLTPVDGLTDDGSQFAVKSVLPPIGVAAAQEKSPLPDDQAGPLPAKAPIDVATANNNNNNLEQLPPTRHNPPGPLGPLQGQVTRSQASTEFDVEVPFEFICPISNDIMKHPVSASDGYTYERRAIKSWFRRNQTSPMTNERLTDLTYRPNEHLEARIKEFRQTHSKV